MGMARHRRGSTGTRKRSVLVVEVQTESMEQRARGQLFVNPNDPRGPVLAVATPPHADDRAGWTWLELDPKRCRQEIRAHNETGFRLVGHWHTHPQAVPRISPTDARSIAHFATRNAELVSSPLAVIVGQSKEPDGIQVWLYRNGTLLQAKKQLLQCASALAGS